MDFKIPAVTHLLNLFLYLLKRTNCSGKCLSFVAIRAWFRISKVLWSVDKSFWIWFILSECMSSSQYLCRAFPLNFLIFINLGLCDFAFSRLTLTMQGLWSEAILMIIADRNIYKIQETEKIFDRLSCMLFFCANLVGKVIFGRKPSTHIIFFSFLDLQRISIEISNHDSVRHILTHSVHDWRKFSNE